MFEGVDAELSEAFGVSAEPYHPRYMEQTLPTPPLGGCALMRRVNAVTRVTLAIGRAPALLASRASPAGTVDFRGEVTQIQQSMAGDARLFTLLDSRDTPRLGAGHVGSCPPRASTIFTDRFMPVTGSSADVELGECLARPAVLTGFRHRRVGWLPRGLSPPWRRPSSRPGQRPT